MSTFSNFGEEKNNHIKKRIESLCAPTPLSGDADVPEGYLCLPATQVLNWIKKNTLHMFGNLFPWAYERSERARGSSSSLRLLLERGREGRHSHH